MRTFALYVDLIDCVRLLFFLLLSIRFNVSNAVTAWLKIFWFYSGIGVAKVTRFSVELAFFLVSHTTQKHTHSRRLLISDIDRWIFDHFGISFVVPVNAVAIWVARNTWRSQFQRYDVNFHSDISYFSERSGHFFSSFQTTVWDSWITKIWNDSRVLILQEMRKKRLLNFQYLKIFSCHFSFCCCSHHFHQASAEHHFSHR